MIFGHLMRPILARLVVTSALVVACAVGCANRGMVAPSEETGTGGGSGGTVALGGSGGSSTGGKGGSAGGRGGGSGGSNVDASCSLMTDALFDHSTTTCNTTFNFEGTTEKAVLVPASSGSQAFTNVAQGTSPHTYCGSGSLAIAAAFNGTTGALVKGEVDIPLGADGGSVDVSGKTLTVHVSAVPAACGEDLRFKVVLDTASGSPTAINVNALTTNFTTASASLSTVAGASATNRIAIQAFSTTNYTGTIYVDEINLQ
jgi:hypothetical protein